MRRGWLRVLDGLMRHPYWSAVGTIITLVIVFWQLVMWLLQLAQVSPQGTPSPILDPVRNPTHCVVLDDQGIRCWEGNELPQISSPTDSR